MHPGQHSIGRLSDDLDENCRRRERRLYQCLVDAHATLADTPHADEFAIARARRLVRDAKARWGAALRDLDGAMGIQ